MTDTSWMPEANGKVVKIVAPLLPYLKGGFDYKIIFMQREIDEVLKSQHVMLNKQLDLEKAYPVVLADAFKKQLEKADAFINQNPNVEVLYVNYKDVVADPLLVAEQVATFLDEEMDTHKMAAAVDGSLYRNKAVTKN